MSGPGKPFMLGGPRQYQWYRLRPVTIIDGDESDPEDHYDFSLWGIETDEGWKGWLRKGFIGSQEPILYLKGLWHVVKER